MPQPEGFHPDRVARQPLRSAQAGVSLIEVLVAVSIFAVGAAAIAQLLTHQIRAAGASRRQSVAYAVAAEKLEAVRALEYGDIESTTEELTVDNLDLTVQTTARPGYPGPNMADVRVDVAWNEPGGQKHVEVWTIYTAVRR